MDKSKNVDRLVAKRDKYQRELMWLVARLERVNGDIDECRIEALKSAVQLASDMHGQLTKTSKASIATD